MKPKFWNFSRFNWALLLLLFAATDATAFAMRYVKVVASGSGDGSSWANASANLQAMIQVSAVGDSVWVAAGTYKPTNKPYNAGVEISTSDNRDRTFHVKDGVKLFGSFAGTETALAQRNIVANLTMLTGDFNDNDVVSGSGRTLSITNNSDNAYHVMIASAAPNESGVTIDGFTIQGGNARGSGSLVINGNSLGQNFGGGIYTTNGTNTLTHNTISSNSANFGGICTMNGTNTITHNTISSNLAVVYGGGIYTRNGTNTLTHNTISSNRSDRGGGIYTTDGTNTLTHNTISSNSATGFGGGIYLENGTNTLTHNTFSSNSALIGGGIYVVGYRTTQSLPILNCVFYKNSGSVRGGAIGYSDMSAPGTLQITHSTFYNNISPSGGAVAIDYWGNGRVAPIFKNCILWGNSVSFTSSGLGSYQFQNCLVPESNCPSNSSCSNMIYNQNPLFVDESAPDGADNLPRTADDGLQLQLGSPCLNAGLSVAGTTADILGTPHIANPDLGAYEVGCTVPTTYAVTGGGAYCAGETGVAIGLAQSEMGVNYQLKKDGINVGSVVAGTGATLNFGNQTVGGTYTVNAIRIPVGCSQRMTGSAVISIHPLPTVTVTSPHNAICNGATETFTANPMGGSGTYTYRWNDNSTNTTLSVAPNANATYSVTVTDAHNCIATNSKSLIINASPLLVVRNTTPILCNGGLSQGTFGSNLGTPPFQYSLNGWNYQSNHLLELAAGMQRIWVRDTNNCIDSTGSVTVVQPALLMGSLEVDTLICKGKTTPIVVKTTGGTGTVLYRLNNGVFQNSLPSVGSGTHTVQIRDTNQCLKTLPSVKIEEGVAKTDGLRSLTVNCHETNMRIYPNPVVDEMAVDFKISQQSTVKILIYNSLGDLIAKKDYLTMDAGHYTTSWNTSNWAAQFVRVGLEVNGTCVQVTSIIIVH